MAEEPALAVANAQGPDRRRLILCLYHLRDRRHFQVRAEFDQMGDEIACPLVAGDIAHEPAVYLDGVSGQAVKIVKRGGTDAEIIQTDPDAGPAQAG